MTKVLFLDLETTGLDVELDPILEVGAILYDLREEREIAVVHVYPTSVNKNSIRFDARIDRVVYEMHTQSGLWDDLVRGERRSKEYESWWTSHEGWSLDVIRLLVSNGMTKGECMMAGRSPSFDRRFLAKHAPRLDAFLSHRMTDVSTLTQLSKAWGPEKIEDVTKKNDPHRAIEDCREAIATLLKYRSVFAGFDLHPEWPNKLSV